MDTLTIFIITFIVVFCTIYFGYQFIEKIKEDFSNIKNFFKSLFSTDESVEKNKSNKKNSEMPQPNYMPYAKRSILTKTEQNFYTILVYEAQKRNLQVCPKVRLEDIIRVTDKQNETKYRGYIKSRHVDFVLLNPYSETIAAVELDDPSHNTQKATKIDTFKNNLFFAVGIPLIRIYVTENYKKEINYAFDELNIPIVESNGVSK